MKHRRPYFLYIAATIWLFVALSWGFVFRQVLYLTDKCPSNLAVGNHFRTHFLLPSFLFLWIKAEPLEF